MELKHIDYSRLPEHIQDGARMYVEHGIQPGSFLTAVIQNDLRQAVSRCVNPADMFAAVLWLYGEAPSMCWGSSEMMAQWMLARSKSAVE